MFPKGFVNQLIQAVLHVVMSVVKVFLLPLNLWIKSAGKLAEQRKQGTIDMCNINTAWPYFSWSKRWIIDFSFDALSFISYPLGFLSSFVVALAVMIEEDFIMGVLALFGSLASTYFFPAIISFLHDVVVFLLLPINKLVDWLKKPAQHLDLNVEKKGE